MSPHGTSSLAPNKTVGRRDNCTVTHSQRRLDRLTKVAVESAYKLHTESRRLVHIVETQSCGDSSTRLGCSSPFFSFSSALLKTSSSTTPSPSKDWALSRDLSDRCSVAARIHALLNQWRADASSEWRARAASVVPILEEVLYKKAKSQEEYTNPQLLESQLMNVLCHFEAGNGPFLLQGSSPLYPVRACIPPSSSSNRLSPLCQNALGQGVSENGNSREIACEETHERARFTCTQSPALASSPISTGAVPSHSQANDTIQTNCDAKVSTDKNGGSHTSSKIVKKFAAMLSSKKRKEKGKCLKQGLERDDQGADSIEKCIINSEMEAVGKVEANNDGTTCDQSPLNSCRGNGRMRSTLGGILELDMFGMESSSVISAESSPLSPFSTNDGNIIGNSGAEASDQAYVVDSQFADTGGLSYLHSSLGQIVHLDEGRGANCKRKAMPQLPLPSTSSPCSSSSSASSASSSSASPLGRSLSCSPSSAPAPSVISAEASPLSPLETSCNIISNSGAEASDRAYIGDSQLADAGELSYLHSSLGQIDLRDKGQGANCERKVMFQFPSALTPSPRPSSSSSASPSSESPPGRSLSCSPSSSAQLSSASTPSPSQPHQAPLMLRVRSSSSPPQENFIRASRKCLKAMPQHQSSSSSSASASSPSPSPQLALLSASSGVPSVELNYAQLLMCEDHQNGAANDYNRTNALLQARQGKEQATQIAFEQSITQTTSEEPRKTERGESSSTSSTASLPSESNEELTKTREKKVKLPLRSFLAEREEYMGWKSSYKEGGPWDTWEEVT